MGTRVIRRTKDYFKVGIAIGFSCILLFGITIGSIYVINYKKAIKVVNFSIDDATSIFQDITVNQYESIFNNPILGKLKSLHDDYDITVTLYVYGQLSEFSIWDMSVDYKHEFRDNADWLKIGFHSPTEDNPVGLYSEKEYEYEYARVKRAIWRFAGEDSVAHVLRLHYWSATDEMVNYLKAQGIIGLLCKDSKATSYNLTEEQSLKMFNSRDGLYKVNDFTYYVTDIRLENTENIIEYLQEKKRDRVIIIFTHAWCFEEQYNKLKEAMIYLSENGYQFSTLDEISK